MSNNPPTYSTERAEQRGSYKRARKYLFDRIANRPRSSTDTTFAHRARAVSDAFAAAEILANAVGELDALEIDEPKLASLTASMIAQVNMQLTNFKEGL